MPGYALDLSRYTTESFFPGLFDSNGHPVGGVLTPGLVQSWMDNGYTHAIISTIWPRVAAHQLEVCHSAGMTVDVYSWLYWDRDMKAYIAERVHLADAYPIRVHWLDAEQAAPGIPHVNVVASIRDAVTAVRDAGQRPGIYTGMGFWPEGTGDSKDFKDLPLWHAQYVHNSGTNVTKDEAHAFRQARPFQSYGGWTRYAIWQYAGDVKAMGCDLDFNVMELDAMEDDMFVRFNAVATSQDPAFHWENTVINDAGMMRARDDFHLPPAASRIRIEVFLKSGSLDVLDGGTMKYAGQCGYENPTGKSSNQIDVTLDAAGQINFLGRNAMVDKFLVVGYW